MTESIHENTSDRTADSRLAVIVLAAGQGTRMKSSLPKVLHRIGGRSLVGHVLDTAYSLAPERVVVVVRHERDLVAAAVLDAAPAAPAVVVVDQDDVPGTGRAVEMALAQLAASTATCSCSAPMCPCSRPARWRACPDPPRRCGGGDRAERARGGCDGLRSRHPRLRRRRAAHRRAEGRDLGRGSCPRDQRGRLCVPGARAARAHLTDRHRQRAGRDVPDRRRRHCCAPRGCRWPCQRLRMPPPPWA